MRVLLSGSSGLIGRALAGDLAADGHGVVRLARPGAAAPTASGAVAWDPAAGHLDRAALEAAGPYDAVVHLAGAGIGDRRWNDARRREIRSSRVTATTLLAEALAGLDPRPAVLVSASAVGYYGDRGDEAVGEDSPAGTGFLAEVCVAWEAATAPAAAVGIRVVTLRTGVVLTGGGGALAKLLPLFRLGLGGRLGSGRQYLSWITLDDEVAVIRRAVDDTSLAGPLNATAPTPVTNAEFTHALGRALRRPAVLWVPRPVLEVALGADMTREMLLGGQRVLPRALLAAGHRFGHPELEGALAALVSTAP